MSYRRRPGKVRLLLRKAASPSFLRVSLCVLACGAAVLGIGLAADSLPVPLPAVMRTFVVGGAVAAVAGLALRARRSSVRRQRDEQAAQTLDLLRLEALQPGSALLEVHAIQWATASGQRVWAVDVLTGAVIDYWLPGPTRPLGSLVLVRQGAERPREIVARLDQAALAAAHRHLRAQAETAGAVTHSVVQEAESLLRRQGSSHPHGPAVPEE